MSNNNAIIRILSKYMTNNHQDCIDNNQKIFCVLKNCIRILLNVLMDDLSHKTTLSFHSVLGIADAYRYATNNVTRRPVPINIRELPDINSSSSSRSATSITNSIGTSVTISNALAKSIYYSRLVSILHHLYRSILYFKIYIGNLMAQILSELNPNPNKLTPTQINTLINSIKKYINRANFELINAINMVLHKNPNFRLEPLKTEVSILYLSKNLNMCYNEIYHASNYKNLVYAIYKYTICVILFVDTIINNNDNWYINIDISNKLIDIIISKFNILKIE